MSVASLVERSAHVLADTTHGFAAGVKEWLRRGQYSEEIALFIQAGNANRRQVAGYRGIENELEVDLSQFAIGDFFVISTRGLEGIMRGYSETFYAVLHDDNEGRRTLYGVDEAMLLTYGEEGVKGVHVISAENVVIGGIVHSPNQKADFQIVKIDVYSGILEPQNNNGSEGSEM